MVKCFLLGAATVIGVEMLALVFLYLRFKRWEKADVKKIAEGFRRNPIH